MQLIEKAWSMVIDITNHCRKTCLYCSRYIRHIKAEQRYHMPPEEFENILKSLDGWPTKICIIGGEPLLHPQLKQINKIIRSYYPPVKKMLGRSNYLEFGNPKIGIFTSGLPGTNLEEPRIDRDLRSTYGFFFFNPHNVVQEKACRHQPLTVSINEAVPDKKIQEKLIDNCWVQRYWSPSVNIKGAYFCEIAASLDYLLYNGANAWPIEKGWWKRDPNCRDFKNQRDLLCQHCGMPIPMERETIEHSVEKFSPGLLSMFQSRGLKRLGEKHVEVFTKQLTKEEIRRNMENWYPFNYREDVRADDALANFHININLE